MDTNEHELLYKNEVFNVTGCAMAVMNKLGQMMNYLKITGLRLGLIFNFKHAKLEWRRVIL